MQYDDPKTAPKVQPTKEVVEKDTIVNGILYIKNPVILNSGFSNNAKGKGKDENHQVQLFILNPENGFKLCCNQRYKYSNGSSSSRNR